MSESELQFRLQTLAALPPDHPERPQFDAALATLPPEEREQWQQVRRESDLLHSALAETNAPASLQAKLLAIPAPTSALRPAPSRKRLFAYAACLLILIPFAIYGIMEYMNEPPTPSYAYGPALETQLANQIADLAVQNHQKPPAMSITSSDPAAVAAALKTSHMPFPTMILTPSFPLKLLGGGICDFGPTKAIFTRWQSTTATYTVYQFDGTPFHVPAGFQPETVPCSTVQTDRVALWPAAGNVCTWAVVLENPQTGNPFYY